MEKKNRGAAINNQKTQNNPNELTKFERYYLTITVIGAIFTFLTVIVASYSLVVSINNANNAPNLTNYQIQQQLLQQTELDKHEAAEQFYYEINRINKTLPFEAIRYWGNLDLASDGKYANINRSSTVIYVFDKDKNNTIPFLISFANNNFTSEQATMILTNGSWTVAK